MTDGEKCFEAFASMLRRGYIPLVLIGVNESGDTVAASIDPKWCDAELLRKIICRCVVGDIDPTLLKGRGE